MHPATRLLVRHFVQDYLHPEVPAAGDRQHGLATGVGLLVSPGLFVTVLLAAKYVLVPFPLPGDAAVAGLFDRLLLFSTSSVVLALVALLHWDRLALEPRDANILGALPLPATQIIRSKWMATASFAIGAAVLLNALPSTIYPLLSVARLQATWSLVAWLTVWQFAVSVLAGATGFLSVLTLRELLWATLGPRQFSRVSATVQAVLVSGCVIAFLLLPSLSARALRERHSVRWLPPLAFAGLFEAGGGRLVAALPTGDVPPIIASRGAAAAATYRRHLHDLEGAVLRAVMSVGALAMLAIMATAWNGRRLPPAVATVTMRGHVVSRCVSRALCRVLIRRPEVQAGAFFAARTFVRNQPHRLAMAVALAAGLASGTIGLVREPPQPVGFSEAPLTVLSAQTWLVMCLVAGTGFALRRAADVRAAWIFSLAWNRDRRRYVTGVGLGTWVVTMVPVLMLVSVHARLFGLGWAVVHALFGLVLALLLVEVLILMQEALPLVESAASSEFTRAVPALAFPAAVMMAALLAVLERAAPLLCIAGLGLCWAAVRTARLRSGGNDHGWSESDLQDAAGLGLDR